MQNGVLVEAGSRTIAVIGIDNTIKGAEKIAEKSAPSVIVAKECVNEAFETTLREGVRFERRLFHSLFAFDDQSEGMEAFIEKRQPKFNDS